MVGGIEAEVAELEQRVGALRSALQFAPRAFVMEFAGTPKSGKSTSVEGIRHFFSRHGFRVHVLVERASVCPIPMKGHLYFNTWCATTMLAELLANVDTETDLIIVDRGLFDALVWLTLQSQRGEVTAAEAKTIENFLLLERWRTLIDLAVVMNVNPEQAIARENSQRISAKPGSIMNPDVLSAISESVETTVERYGSKFGDVIIHDTTGEDVRQSNVRLAGKIIDHLASFLNPEILVVPSQELAKLPWENGGAFTADARDMLMTCISTFGRYMKRSDAEIDSDYLQIIPCGILVYGTQIFLFERKERDPKYRLYGRTTIWQGCHVAKQADKEGLDLLKGALLERITRSLYLSRIFPIEFEGYCWDPNDEKSNRHFGVIFRVTINNDHTATDLRKKEFRTGRGHGLAGGFVSSNDLSSAGVRANLETWSLAILNGMHMQDLSGQEGVV
jgi:predicted NUDIX family phosphoesterase